MFGFGIIDLEKNLKIFMGLLIRNSKSRSGLRQGRHTLRPLKFMLAMLVLSPCLLHAFEVTHFSPEGLTNSVRQVKVTFSEPMIALSGSTSNSNIFKVDCLPAQNGYARWKADKSWVYNFFGNMTGGSKCQFTLKNGLTSLAGSKVVGQSRFEFSLDGPLLTQVYPYNLKKIHPDQPFVLVPEVDVDLESLQGKVYFMVQNDPSATSLRVEADIFLARDMEHRDLNDAILKAVSGYMSQGEKEKALIVVPRSRFAENSKGYLYWSAGIKGASGKFTKKLTATYAFSVIGDLEIEVVCNDIESSGGCNPLNGIDVKFSHHVPTSLAQGLQLWDIGDGRVILRPVKPANLDSHVDMVSFEAPFKENHKYRLFVPDNFNDEDGRKPINVAQYSQPSGYIATGAVPPLVRFAGLFGVLESKLRVLQVPLKVRRVEAQLARADFTERQFFQLAGLSSGDESESRLTSGDGNTNNSDSVGIAQTVGVKSFKLDAASLAEAIRFFRWVNSEGGQNSESLFTRMGAVGKVRKSHVTVPTNDQGLVDENIIGLKVAGKGFHIIEVASQKLGAAIHSSVQYVSSSVLVTNLAIHTKISPKSSLVWVTRLDSGIPVAGASVRLADCSGAVLWSGETDAQGLTFIKAAGQAVDVVKLLADRASCESLGQSDEEDYDDYGPEDPYNSGGFITAQIGNDFSLSHTSWTEGIEPYRFNVSDYIYDYKNRGFGKSFLGHTVMDRALFKLGETVSMKHVFRSHNGLGPQAPLAQDLPEKIWIVHMGSGEKYELNIDQYNAKSGTAFNQWVIPAAAKFGRYEVQLVKGLAKRYPDKYGSANFRIGDFKLPSMLALVNIRPSDKVAAEELTLNLTLSHLNGGPAKHAKLNVRTHYSPVSWPRFADFNYFSFEFMEVQTGESLQGNYEPAYLGKLPAASEFSVKTDEFGNYNSTLTNLPQVDFPYVFSAEMEYFDPTQESHTKSGQVKIWQADKLIGLQVEDGMSGDRKVKIYVAVVTPKGQALAGEQVSLSLFNETYFSIRTAIKGGAFLNQGFKDVSIVDEAVSSCSSGGTNARGVLTCEVKVPANIGGKIWIQAELEDSQGRRSVSKSAAWIDGEYGDFSLGESASRMDLFTDKGSYDPLRNATDQIAKINVGTAFKQAMALVTVEREGILFAKVVKVSAASPRVEIPILKSFVPKAYVSVLAVRGRVGEQEDVGQLDLQRPSFRLGMTDILVNSAVHTLDIEVIPNQETAYKTGQEVTAQIKVVRADGKSLNDAFTEVTLAVVDEALLKIAPNSSWDLLNAMMKERPHKVDTSTTMIEVMGARHLGTKSLPSGGGGGQVPNTREVSDALVAWIPNVVLKKGQGVAKFKLNDSLTKFRIVAIANSEADLFGRGEAFVTTNQDLIIINGLSQTARSEDQFASEWTVRNTSKQVLQVKATAWTQFTLTDGSVVKTVLEPRRVEIPAEDSSLVDFGLVAIPDGARGATYFVKVEGPNGEMDSFVATQKILPQVRALPLMTMIAQIGTGPDELSSLAVELPDGADATLGGVNITLAKSLSEGLSGVQTAMEQYPYLKSLIFQLAEWVVRADPNGAAGFLNVDLPSYLGSEDGFLKNFKGSPKGSPQISVRALSLLNELSGQGVKIDQPVTKTLVKALVSYAKGELRKSEAPWDNEHVDQKKILVLRLSIAATLQPLYAEVSQTVAALLPQAKTDEFLGVLDTAALLNWHTVLEPRIGQTVTAAQELLLKQIRKTLANRVNFGTRTAFVDSANSSSYWSGLNRSAVQAKLISRILSSSYYQSNSSPWKAPEVRALLLGLNQDRQVGRGSWRSSLANAFGSSALRDFTSVYENDSVSGISFIKIGSLRRSVDWPKARGEQKYHLPWESTELELSLTHRGAGQPWATVTTVGAIPITADQNRGLRILKSIVPIRQHSLGKWTRTDIIEVTVQLKPDVDLGAVVLYDPIPAGAKIITESSGGYGYYTESKAGVFKAYVANLSQSRGGSFSYQLQLNSVGTFGVPATIAESVSQPETNGVKVNNLFAIESLFGSSSTQIVIHDLPDDAAPTEVAEN